MAETKTWFTAAELAAALGISLPTLDKSVETGAVPAPVIFGKKSRRWPLDTVTRVAEIARERAATNN